MADIHFTSDTHYHHSNIVLEITKWRLPNGEIPLDRVRDFKTLEDMDEALIERINSSVSSDDTLYHLGDWSFGGFERIQEFREKINCNNIHLVLGNHDHHIESNRENVQKLFSSVSHYKEHNIGKLKIVMSHYAMKVWNKIHDKSWMLHGHSHGTLSTDDLWIYGIMPDPTHRRTMDVGVDTNKLFPYHIDEIAAIMDLHGFKPTDQHK